MKVKTVFHVEIADNTKEVIVEKSQIEFEITDHVDRLSIANLARYHKKEIVDLLDPATGPTMSDALKSKLHQIDLDNNYIEEILTCQGDLIWRFIRNKLREWAQKQLSKEPPPLAIPK